MKNWYRSAPIKGILIAVEHICAVVMTVCMIVILTYPGWKNGDGIGSRHKSDYSDSKGFAASVEAAAQEILQIVESAERLETDGKYDPDKIVDIETYISSGQISKGDEDGLSYRLGDLEKVLDEEEFYERIIVCKKPDETYTYFDIKDFTAEVEAGELAFSGDDGQEYLDALKEGDIYEGYFEGTAQEIVNEKKEVIYTDFWNFNQCVRKNLKTIDGKTLLDVVNENPHWNGRLTNACNCLDQAVSDIGYEVRDYKAMKEKWDERNSNLTYLFIDLEKNQLYSNRQKYNSMQLIYDYVEEMKQDGKYVVAAPKLADFETNMDVRAVNWCKSTPIANDYIYMISVDTDYPIQDQFYMQKESFDVYAPYMNKVIAGTVISITGFIIGLVWLTIIAGRRAGDDELTLVWFDKIKTEIGTILVLAVWAGCVEAVITGTNYSKYYYTDNMIEVGIIAFVSCTGFLAGYLSFVRRIKAKTLWKNSVLCRFIKAVKTFLQYRSCTFKAALAVMAFIIVHWIVMIEQSNGNGRGMFLMLLAEGAALYFILRGAVAKQKIKEGIQEIVDGNVNYQIPLVGLKGDDFDMAEHINHIGEGLNKAVEQSMKDERLKTDLITNVSHDIKTPLTSIINYVDLLKRENIQDPKIQGYLDILEAKSQRLKQLTEDVVEASKISSGNITMEYMDINFVEMIKQTTGEFDEKFAKRNLHAVLNVPDHPVMIHSDGRRMWRVIENIYNNAAKYALEGTRVYADLIEKEHTVEFSLKNVSEQPLNISADELTERFIRGDISRSTEGSGLGLSIAKNLTQMQGGEFNLYLDGDLFKVTIIFPKVV